METSEGPRATSYAAVFDAPGDRPPRYELRTFEASRPGGLSYQEGSVVAHPKGGINTETEL